MIKLQDLLNRECTEDRMTKLFESPMLMGDYNVQKLADTASNLLFTRNTIKKCPSPISAYKEFSVYSCPMGTEYTSDIFVVDELTKVTFVYYIKDNRFYEKQLYQDHLYKGAARDIVFNYYLTRYDSIVSDEVHTPLGKGCWDKMIRHALTDAHYAVFAVDQHGVKAQAITNMDQLNQYYGWTGKYANVKLMIEVVK